MAQRKNDNNNQSIICSFFLVLLFDSLMFSTLFSCGKKEKNSVSYFLVFHYYMGHKLFVLVGPKRKKKEALQASALIMGRENVNCIIY